MLHQLDGVTIWVDDERDRDRPSIQSFWLHSGLEARSHGGIVHGDTIIDIEVDLPQRPTMVDVFWRFVMLRKLKASTALVGGENDLVHAGNLGS